jgi:hypothetical protein
MKQPRDNIYGMTSPQITRALISSVSVFLMARRAAHIFVTLNNAENNKNPGTTVPKYAIYDQRFYTDLRSTYCCHESEVSR